MQNYYEAKEKNSVLFNLNGPSRSKAFLESGTVFMLPKRDQHGREVYVFRMGKFLLYCNLSFCFVDMYRSFKLRTDNCHVT